MSKENIKPTGIEQKKTPSIEEARLLIFGKAPRSVNNERDIINTLTRKQKEVKKRFISYTRKAYNFVSETAKKSGIEDVYINPDSDSYFEFTLSRDSFIFPEKYLSPLGDLLESSQKDYTEKFAAKSVGLLIEIQHEFLKGETFEQLKKSTEITEKLYKLDDEYDNQERNMDRIINHKNNLKNKDEKIESVLESRIFKKGFQQVQRNCEKEYLKEELNQSNFNISDLVYAQFMDKIQKDPKRDAVEDIATMITFIDLSHVDNIFLALVRNKGINHDQFEATFSKTIPDDKMRENIFKKCLEIRGKLLDSY